MAHSIFIFVPAYGQMISSATFLSTHALQQTLMQKSIGGGISTLSFPDIAELRAMATSIWYDTMPHSSHILFVDNDMGFAPDIVLDMLMLDEPLVGAIYRQRREPESWAGSGTGEPLTQRRGNFMQVEGTGMGIALIRRDLITKMIEHFPELVDERIHLHPAGDTLRQAGTKRMLRFFEKLDVADRGLISEDLSFCIRAKQVGVDCWASIGHPISHVGPHDYHGCYLHTLEKLMREGGVPALPVSVGGSTTAEQIALVGQPVNTRISPEITPEIVAPEAVNGGGVMGADA